MSLPSLFSLFFPSSARHRRYHPQDPALPLQISSLFLSSTVQPPLLALLQRCIFLPQSSELVAVTVFSDPRGSVAECHRPCFLSLSRHGHCLRCFLFLIAVAAICRQPSPSPYTLTSAPFLPLPFAIAASQSSVDPVAVDTRSSVPPFSSFAVANSHELSDLFLPLNPRPRTFGYSASLRLCPSSLSITVAERLPCRLFPFFDTQEPAPSPLLLLPPMSRLFLAAGDSNPSPSSTVNPSPKASGLLAGFGWYWASRWLS